MMSRLALTLLLLATPARAQDAAPFLLRVAVAPDGPVWVGQRVSVTLTAMTPVRFVDPPSWPDLMASQGRIIVVPEATTVPGTERVSGESYAALQHSYSLFPAAEGALVLAPIRMSVRVGGADGQPVSTEAATEQTRIAVRVPPGVTDLTRFVVAPSFQMTARTEGEVSQVHVGDAVVRTLRMDADDTTAMLLPAAAWGEPEGVRVYPDPPVLQDDSERGVLRAMRSERAAFVPQRPGLVELPGFEVTWLDPRSGQARQVRVEPLRLDVLPVGGPQATTGRGGLPWLWIALTGAVLLLGGLAVPLWLRRRRRPAGAAPPIRALAAACRAGDAEAALRALYRWADALPPPGGERTLGALARRAGVPALATEAEALEIRIFRSGDAKGWSGAALLAAAHQAERALHRRSSTGRSAALPALNPIGDARPPSPRLTQPRWTR